MKKLFNAKHPIILALAGAFFFISGITIVWLATMPIPDLKSFDERKVVQATKIYDRTGEVLLYNLHQDVKRTVIPFDQISRHIKNASVAIEDEEFYNHMGIKPTAIIRAVLVNVLSLEFEQGGSTITQQVVKNSLLTTEKLISRKLKEWALAIRIEQMLSKEEILEIYLNESPYGGTLYGVEEASRAFFGKSAADVTLAEAAYLAALPQAPTYYSPYGNNRDRLEDRKNLVLAQMLKNGFITEAEYEEAKQEEVTFKQHTTGTIEAPHFVFYVIEQLEREYGKRFLDENGLKVITTLDAELQRKGQEIVRRYALENEEKFNAENAGLTAVDPKTGDILVMVGSRGYEDPDIDGMVNVAVSPQQPGSSFKPFVYATAFNKGYTPETVVFDLRTQFSTACAPDDLSNESPCFAPNNYDNEFRGPMTLRDALAQSVNIPAVKMLYLAGMRDSLDTARAMGVSSLGSPDLYGLSLVLGSGDVTLLDMTSAYGVFARDGERTPHHAILRIENAAGEVIFEHENETRTVLPKNTARLISDVLSDNAARTPAFGANSGLHFPNHDVAAKTGTTNDYRDAWVVGYTPDIAVGAWAGNNDNSSMEKRVDGFIIVPLWNEFMQEVMDTYGRNRFVPPDPEDAQTLKPILRNALAEMPSAHSILHWVKKDDPRGSIPENPAQDSQYALWEYPVSLWAADGNFIPRPGAGGGISFSSPQSDRTYNPNESITVSIVFQEGGLDISRVEYRINAEVVHTSTEAPYAFAFTPNEITTSRGTNVLEARAYTSDGRELTGATTFSTEN